MPTVLSIALNGARVKQNKQVVVIIKRKIIVDWFKVDNAGSRIISSEMYFEVRATHFFKRS